MFLKHQKTWCLHESFSCEVAEIPDPVTNAHPGIRSQPDIPVE
jgi:hypothetical protein